MDLEATDASTQQNPEQMDEQFTTTAYLNVQENLKLPSEDPMILEEPASSTRTLSSLPNLEKELSFTDQFFMEKHQEEEPRKTNAEVEKKRKRHDLPRTPSGSPPSQPLPPPPPAGTSGALASALQFMAWTTYDTRYDSASVYKTQELSPTESLIQDDFIPDEQVYLSDDEDSGNDHLPKADSRKDWWKPLPKEERPATPEPTWTIFSSNKFYIDRHDSPSRRKEVRSYMRILSVVRIKAYSRYGYDYLSKIVLRRADLQEHTIAEKDFKNLYLIDFEELNLLLLQGHLDHLLGSNKQMLSTAVKLWTRNLVIRQRVEDFQLGIKRYQTQLNLTKPGWDATSYEFKHDYAIIESPRAVVFPINNNERNIIWFNKIYKFSDDTLTRILEALAYRVKEFKIKQLNLVDFNSLVHSFRALSALRHFGLRTASAAAKPCQGDSLELYLITCNIYTDKRGTVVLATLFNESEQRHFRVFITNVYLQES
uniref:Uncharacterized protein n=1 Tax=Tanacetum cinerariifolium TaxID=118510 RepID=A0A6L2J6V0_TANCI|nr:hypothetical protein [Tanacetum cinerariifolium]